MKKKIVIPMIAVLLFCVGFSGCFESDEDKAERIGREYLWSYYTALEHVGADVLEKFCIDKGDHYRVGFKCRVYGYVHTNYYVCKVDKNSWEAYDAEIYDD